jgi:enoyl-CoA hydratase/carnithine racemase
MSELVDLRVEAEVAVLSFNRPERRNAFNDELRGQFTSALERVAANDSIRALVLTGAGKSFCAGGDVAAMARRLDAPAGEVAFAGWRRQQGVHHAQVLLHTLPIPTVAAVNGAAAGLGADTALACDFVIAGHDASFSWPYINRGLIADGGAMFFLPRRVGLSRAKELIFSGRRVAADEALKLGIADRVCASGALVESACAWAKELSRGSRAAVALGKSILNTTFEQSVNEIFALGSQAQGICYTTSAHRQSVEEFLAGAARNGAKGKD